VGRRGGHRLKISGAGYVVEPDGTEGCYRPVGRDGYNVKVSAVQRRVLNVAIPGHILPGFDCVSDLLGMKGQAGGVATLEQFGTVAQ